MCSIRENLKRIKADLPSDGVRLVAVSKFHPVTAIRSCYDAGQRIFGESRVQELCEKQPLLPDDVEWHFIGHLQTNKVKFIVPFVSLIHSVDSWRLLQEINRHAARVNRQVRCLLQLHVAAEETKFGFTPDECRQMLAEGAWRALQHVRLSGIMCMATNTPDRERIRADFRQARLFHEEIKAKYFPDDAAFCEKSYGMSDDWQIALEEGSTLVRIGTAVFGVREY